MNSSSSKTKFPATLLCDFYKVGHRQQYPDNTETVFATWTARSNKHYPSCDKVVAFGFQGAIKKILIDYFDTHFFSRPKQEVVDEYTRFIKYTLFIEDPDSSHITELHDLGYLPIEIKALPEGTLVPLRVPMLTIENTNKKFGWITNYFETVLSSEFWGPATNATIANRYKKILNKYAVETGGSLDFVPFQGHDFSMRGGMGLEGATLASTGHLLSFVGTDTIPAIAYMEAYYNANIETELVGTSVNATEHSVMCAGGKNDELETYRRLIEDVYPSGIISIVSDTWDLWNTITNILPVLKDKIMSRDGKVVIRPDSGDPVDIICGLRSYHLKGEILNPEDKGVIELLWDIFGGTTNDKGYKELDSHIGAIYGDSITPERAEQICKRLEVKGFASTNIVFGIGSYTYQFNTRDTFGFAMKSTACIIDGVESMIFKDPVTDDGTKKSLTGGVAVLPNAVGGFMAVDNLPIDNDIEGNCLRTIFKDGKIVVEDSLKDIRARLANH